MSADTILNRKILDLIESENFKNIDILSATSCILIATCIKMKMPKPHFLSTLSCLYEELSEIIENDESDE